VTFHEKIGAHDIADARASGVTEVLNGDKLVDWVNDYLKTQGVEDPFTRPLPRHRRVRPAGKRERQRRDSP